jgi:DNA-binding NarL/FixJ family response regulator
MPETLNRRKSDKIGDRQRQLRSEIGRRGAMASLDELARQHSVALDRLEALHAKERKLAGQVDGLTQEKKQARATKRQPNVTTEAERQARVARVQGLKLNGASNAEISRELGVSKATVRRDVSELEKMAA